MPTYLDNTNIYNYPLFCQIWKDKDAFLTDYKQCGIPTSITDESATLLYNLLLGEYYNSPIGYNSVGQWKQQFMTIIYCYGPSWEKRLDLQDKLRNITDEELLEGTTMIYNTAQNPSTPVTNQGTNTKHQLGYISNQNVSLSQKSKLEAYATLNDVLRKDVTTELLSKFRPLFCGLVAPQLTPVYVYDKEDD